MSISEPFIRRPVATTLLAVALCAVGVFSYDYLPVAAMPSVEYPTITVSANPMAICARLAAASGAATARVARISARIGAVSIMHGALTA